MRYGLYLPNFGAFGDARVLAEVARDAERAGWDGIYIWDHVARDFRSDVVDPWVALTAIAVATERLRIGALVTPLPRRRPWKVARESVSLDRLSEGRLVFGAGIGSGAGSEWERLGEEADDVTRGAMLDEGLEVLAGLWSGEPLDFEGRHYRARETRFEPVPVQRPRIPVWIAALWPSRPPLRRAARWDGLFALFRDGPPHDLAQLGEAVEQVREARRSNAPFDVVHLGRTDRCDPAEYARAGATWLLEPLYPDRFGARFEDATWPLEKLRDLVRAGPPTRMPRHG